MNSIDPLLPNFVIIGAQKSASTYLSEALRQHPSIYLPPQEVRYFEDPEYTPDDIGPLKTLFQKRREPLKGIKRPDYLARSEVPARIRRHVPDAKLLVVLREPVARLISAYYFYIKMGFLPPVHINRGLPSILDDSASVSSRAAELVEYGRYATHLERYREYFPSSQVLVLLQDEISTEPQEALRKVYKFLGLPEERRLPKVARDNSGLYSIPRLRLLTQRNRFVCSYDSSKKIEITYSPSRYFAAASITALDRYVLARFIDNEKPKLDPALHARLKTLYRPELNRLEHMLKCDLADWK